MDQLHYPQRVGKDNSNPIIRLTVEVGGKLKITRGRDAWTLSELISSGSLGVTPIEPAFLGDDSDAVKISAARYSGNRVAENYGDFRRTKGARQRNKCAVGGFGAALSRDDKRPSTRGPSTVSRGPLATHGSRVRG